MKEAPQRMKGQLKKTQGVPSSVLEEWWAIRGEKRKEQTKENPDTGKPVSLGTVFNDKGVKYEKLYEPLLEEIKDWWEKENKARAKQGKPPVEARGEKSQRSQKKKKGFKPPPKKQQGGPKKKSPEEEVEEGADASKPKGFVERVKGLGKMLRNVLKVGHETNRSPFNDMLKLAKEDEEYRDVVLPLLWKEAKENYDTWMMRTDNKEALSEELDNYAEKSGLPNKVWSCLFIRPKDNQGPFLSQKSLPKTTNKLSPS